MPIKKFDPHFQINFAIVQELLKIEAIKTRAFHLPLTPSVLASLRETARLFSTHYSTQMDEPHAY